MNALLRVLPADGWERLAADALWQSTALAAAGLALAWLLRRRAALRAAVLLSAVMLSVAAPLLSIVVRATGVGALAQPIAAQTLKNASYVPWTDEDLPSAESNASIATPQNESSGQAAAKVADLARTLATGSSWSPARAWPWLAGAWLAVSTFLALRLVRGLVSVRQAIRQAEPCTNPVICVALARASASVSVRPPEVLQSRVFATPALIALLRPRLLVPLEMPRGVDWFAICCHELAHLARRDGASRLAVELCIIVLPWQPLLWQARRQFRSACEEACDDWAVASGADPVEFASLLVALVPKRQPALALGMAESPAATRRRIVRLLAMKGAIHHRLGLVLGLLGWVLAFGLATVIALLQYRAGSRLSHPIQRSDLGAIPDPSPPGDPGVFYNYSTTDSNGTALSGSSPGKPPWGDQRLSDAITRAAVALQSSAERPAPYIIQPPDILQVEIVKRVPRSPYHLEPDDKLAILVANPLIDQPIAGTFTVDVDGEISLGPAYGSIKVSGLTLPEVREALDLQLRQVLRDPQIQVTLGEISSLPPLAGERLVAPDGTINLGTYGLVYVAGKTIGQATDAIEAQLSKKLDRPQASLDVFAFNSKTYYLVFEDPKGDQLVRVPFTGGETVLDALAKGMADRKTADPADYWVWVARPIGSAGNSQSMFNSGSKHEIFTSVDGVVDEVPVETGQFVKQGDTLARLSNAELEKSITELQAKLAATQKKISSSDPKSKNPPPDDGRVEVAVPEGTDPDLFVEKPSDEPAPNLDQLQAIENLFQQQLKRLARKRERLTITSPVDGQISTPQVRERLLGKAVRQGQVLMTVMESVDPSGPTPDDTTVKTFTYTVPFQTYQLKSVETIQLPAGEAATPPTAEPASDVRDHILPVDWQRVVEGTDTTSNWQLKSGDRIFVRSKPGH